MKFFPPLPKNTRFSPAAEVLNFLLRCKFFYFSINLHLGFMFKIYALKSLVTYPFSPYNLERSKKNDLEIEKKGLIHHVVLVIVDLNRNRNLIPAVYLSPAGNAWGKNVNSFLCSEFNEVVLVEQYNVPQKLDSTLR